MDRLAFNAAAAINEMRTGRQMTTNELANVATPGFKRSFESAMMTLKVQGAGFESRLQPQAFSSDNINMKPGVIIKTGRDLDVAMDEQTVMGVTAPNGELAFTRRGDLKMNSGGVLELGTGALVRGQNGGPITIPPGFFVKINGVEKQVNAKPGTYLSLGKAWKDGHGRHQDRRRPADVDADKGTAHSRAGGSG